MNEVEFLQKVLIELGDAQYGEGLSFNLSQLDLLIRERIDELKSVSNG
jgi:hypothetical protein